MAALTCAGLMTRFAKRAYNSFRNKKTAVLQLLPPVLFALMAIVLTQLTTPGSDADPIRYTIFVPQC